MATAIAYKYKTFQYTTDLRWRHGRVGSIASEGKPGLDISSPVEFRGEAGHWTPEDLFVASANACLLMTFLANVEREHIAVTFYESSATGTLERVGDGYQFTEVTIRPVIGIEDSAFAGRVEEMLRQAEKNCLIAKSLKATVHVEPQILSVAD